MRREKIYAAVWERPIVQAAKSMRVPVETLHAACRALSIPIPPLLYWINLSAGKAPVRPDLMPFDGPQRYSMGPNDEDEREPIVFTRSEQLLSVEDVQILTGRKYKSQQRDQLRVMQIPFAENVFGQPLIPVAFFEGSKKQAREEILVLQRHLASARASWAEARARRLKGA